MTILHALNTRYERLAARGDLPMEGYSTERISFSIILSPDGEPTRVRDLRRKVKNRWDGRPLPVPQSFKRPGVTPRAFFTWDNSKFVLGVGIEKGGKAMVEYPGHLAAFRELHGSLLKDANDAAASALLRFMEKWTPARFQEDPMFSPEMLEANIVFELAGDTDDRGSPRFLHDRPAIRRIWDAQMAGTDVEEGLCLVTGERAPIARIHRAIKGVFGGQAAGTSIVSFEKDAFKSYGKDRGANAPVSQSVASGYVAALNAMLDGTDHKLMIADSTMVFWADADDERVSKRFKEMLSPDAAPEEAEALEAGITRKEEKAENRQLKDALLEVSKGRRLEAIEPDFNGDPPFHVLGLSPNIARLSVRFWIESTFGEMEANFRQHWDDTAIDPWPWKNPKPSVLGLLRETALLRELKNIPDHLTGEVMRAILTGRRYPRTLLGAVITRMRADQHISGRRAAICRAVLVRDHRVDGDFPARLTTDEQKKEYLVSLDREETNPGYLLGRLFAVLENAQYNALGRINATIRDRYYGAASATPASVFPLLLRTGAHHIAALRKEGKGGWVDREIEEILDLINAPPDDREKGDREKKAEFPKSLSIENQGRFAIGYYHQRAYRKPGEDGAAEPVNTDNQDQEVEG